MEQNEMHVHLQPKGVQLAGYLGAFKGGFSSSSALSEKAQPRWAGANELSAKDM